MNLTTINTIISKLTGAVSAILALAPGIVTGTGTDVTNAVNAVLKVVTDLQTDLTTIINAVKSST
jgi:hypothetical protein